MSKQEDGDLQDVIAEETTRGTKHPKKAISRERKRKIENAAKKLADKGCTEREFLEAVRAIVPDGSSEFLEAAELWKRLRGHGKP